MSEHNRTQLGAASSHKRIKTDADDAVRQLSAYPVNRNESLTKTWGTLVGNGHLSDITFLVKEKLIPAHRFPLAVRSTVFEAMFYGPAKSRDKLILIKDCSAETFESVLLYIYSNEINIHMANIVEVMLTAHKYDLSFLEAHCEEFITVNKNPKNVLPIYDSLYNLDTFLPLKAMLLKYICDNFAKNILAPECLLPITNINTLIHLVDKLVNMKTYCFSDYELFEMLIIWARKECVREKIDPNAGNLRSILNGVENRVQLTSMNPDTISKCVHLAPSFFSSDELNKALQRTG